MFQRKINKQFKQHIWITMCEVLERNLEVLRTGCPWISTENRLKLLVVDVILVVSTGIWVRGVNNTTAHAAFPYNSHPVTLLWWAANCLQEVNVWWDAWGGYESKNRKFSTKKENPNSFESSAQENTFASICSVDLTENLTWLRQGKGPSSQTSKEGCNRRCSLWIGEGDRNFY